MRSKSVHFVTLTYRPEDIRLTAKGYMDLRKSDLQKFFKKMRINRQRSKNYPRPDRKISRGGKKLLENGPPKKIIKYKDPYPIKYYAAGEYGSKSRRPHYHIILFNASSEEVLKAWSHGDVHFGKFSAASATYTLKYISKDLGKYHHQNDDRQKEFALMSKKLGDNYLTKSNIKYHRDGKGLWSLAQRFCLQIPGGKKIAIPRYYKQKIWSPQELQMIGTQFFTHADKNYAEKNYAEKIALDNHRDKLRRYYSHINDDSRRTSL